MSGEKFMKLKEKRVLVTGGALRLGRAICRAFADAGAKVAVHCSKSLEQATELLEELGGEAMGHRVVQCDFSRQDAAEAIFAQAGAVDILVNNASSFFVKPLADETYSEFEEQFNVNFTVPLELMKKFQAQNLDEGCVVNILDQQICKTDSLGGSYLLSKKALAEATISAALQWAPRIRVNGIAPGPVLPPVGMESSKMEKTLKLVPLQRPVKMKDLTDACLFLVKNDSITGNILYVDSGQHLR